LLGGLSILAASKFSKNHLGLYSTCSFICRAGKTQVQLPGASKFCSWPSENRGSVAQWASKISLKSFVRLNKNVT